MSTYHCWKVDPAAAQQTYGGSPDEQDEKIRAQLLEHAELALRYWKTALEAGAVKRSRAAGAISSDLKSPRSQGSHALHAV